MSSDGSHNPNPNPDPNPNPNSNPNPNQVLATPIVLASLAGRTDCFPTLLVASIVAMQMTGDEAIIVAARRCELG